MIRRLVRTVAVATLGLGLSACNDGGPAPADPTVPTAVSSSSSVATTAPSSTTKTPDVSVIPATIDAAYLNAVLAALDEVDGQATRIIKADKRFSTAAADLLNAIYSDGAFSKQSEAWYSALSEDPDLTHLIANPGNRRTTVDRVLTASPQCVWIAVTRDHSASASSPAPPDDEYLTLRPLDRTNDPAKVNPSPWMIDAEGATKDGSEPSNPCAHE